MPRSRYLSPLVLILLASAPGCSDFQKAQFNRGEGVGEDAILVIPFSEPRSSRWYGESDRGKIIAEAFKAWVRANAEPNFPEGETAEQVQRAVRDWTQDSITSPDWKKLTAILGVKYVLFGEIEKISTTRKDMIGMLDPSLTASYHLVNVHTSKLVFERKEVTVDILRGHETEIPMMEVGADLAMVEKRLLAKLGERIGKDLYGYYED